MKDLDEKRLASLVDRIVQAVNPACVFLYGSHAYGHPTRDSDVDLLVVVRDEKKPAWKIACDAYQALRGSQMPIELKVISMERFEKQKAWRSSVECAAAEKGRLLYGRVV